MNQSNDHYFGRVGANRFAFGQSTPNLEPSMVPQPATQSGASGSNFNPRLPHVLSER